MGADTWANIVFANTYKAQRLTGIIGQFVEFHSVRYVVAVNKLVGHGQILGYKLVYDAFNVSNLLLRWAMPEFVVYL